MVTRLLRVTLLAQLGGSIVLAGALLGLGVSAWIAAPLAAVLPVAFHAVPLAIEFVTGALIDRRPVARLGPIALARVWIGETWRSVIAFCIDQPWRANFAEPTIRRNPSRPAVLLIHGYLCNRAVCRPWLASGLAGRWNVATITLNDAFAPIERYSDSIAAAVEQLRAASGSSRITLVCHSMGGLAARAYLRSHGPASIARVITINTPHHGTLFARFGRGENTHQMRRAASYVRKLGAEAEAVEFICFASQHDNLIVPRNSQILAGAEAIWFERLGHLAMTGSDAFLARLIKVVERPWHA